MTLILIGSHVETLEGPAYPKATGNDMMTGNK